MTLRGVIQGLLRGSDDAEAMLADAGYGDLPAEMFGQALASYADTAPMAEADALSPILTTIDAGHASDAFAVLEEQPLTIGVPGGSDLAGIDASFLGAALLGADAFDDVDDTAESDLAGGDTEEEFADGDPAEDELADGDLDEAFGTDGSDENARDEDASDEDASDAVSNDPDEDPDDTSAFDTSAFDGIADVDELTDVEPDTAAHDLGFEDPFAEQPFEADEASDSVADFEELQDFFDTEPIATGEDPSDIDF